MYVGLSKDRFYFLLMTGTPGMRQGSPLPLPCSLPSSVTMILPLSSHQISSSFTPIWPFGDVVHPFLKTMYLFYVIGHSVQLAGSWLPVLGLDSCLAVEALRLSHHPAREAPAPSLSPQQTSVCFLSSQRSQRRLVG